MTDLVHFSSSSTEISHRFKAPVSVGVGYFGSRLGQLLPGEESVASDSVSGGYFTQAGLRQQYRFTPLRAYH